MQVTLRRQLKWDATERVRALTMKRSSAFFPGAMDRRPLCTNPSRTSMSATGLPHVAPAIPDSDEIVNVADDRLAADHTLSFSDCAVRSEPSEQRSAFPPQNLQ